jgi:parallel beta-helix repeat protein
LRGAPGIANLVDLRDRSYVVIDGLTISYGHPPPGGNQRWPWVIMAGNAHHNEIRNCTILREGDPLALYEDGFREWGVMLKGAQHNIVEDNYITGVNQGVQITDLAQYNLVQNNTISGVSQSAIVVGSSQGVIQGNLIQDNLLEKSAVEDGIQFMEDTTLPQGNERKADVSNLGTVVRNNIIRYHNENAIDLKGAAYVVIEDNIIYGCVGSSNGPQYGWNRNAHGTITRGANKSTRDVIIRRNVLYDSAPGIRAHMGYKIYNNTIIGNNRDYTGPNSSWTTTERPAFSGIRQKEAGDGRISILNNIVAGHNTVEVALILREMQAEPNQIDYNLYHNAAGVFFADYDREGVWRRYSFSQWKQHLRLYDTITGSERHSLVAYPRFVSVPGPPVGEHEQFNFSVRDGSFAIDKGGPLTVTMRSGSGAEVWVEDAGFFFDGYGITAGDLVQIGNNRPAGIRSVDYDKNVINLDRAVSWQEGDWVSLPYGGKAPDIGAYECEGECTPAARLVRPGRLAKRGRQAH